jgi:enoyl-CoA hydratase/carnithine racemase
VSDVPVRTTDAGAVRTLVLDRPEARNAFDSALYRALAEALAAARADDAVKVAVVTGAGAGFSAGQDLKEMARLAAGDAGVESAFPELLEALQSFDKPLLAAVHGAAVGIGFTMLAHCDIVVVADDARLRAPFAPLGVAPEAGSSHLFPARMGWQRAAHVLLTGSWVSAEQAVAYGVALEVVPRAELLDRTVALAQEIAAAPLASLRAIKRTMLGAQLPAIVAAREREEAEFAELLRTFRPPG